MKSKNSKFASFEDEFTNALSVINAFMNHVHGNRYGDELHGVKCESDKRFRINVNGSYHELAGYCFTSDWMHDYKDGNGNYINIWGIPDFDHDCIYGGKRMSLGEAYVSYLIENDMHVRLTDSFGNSCVPYVPYVG